MDNIFITTLLADKIKIQPQHINKNIVNVLLIELQNKFEGKCSYHGYIKPSSISIFKYSMGQIQAFSLNGDVVYNVQYHCEVCNPSLGSIVQAKVVNMNKFGILAECSIVIKDMNVPILDIIVTKNTIDSLKVNEVAVDELKKGDDIYIEVLGKKYELNDKKISVVGRIVKNITNAVEDKAGGDSGVNPIELGDEDNSDDDDDKDEDEEDDEDDDENDDDEEKEEEDDEFFGGDDDDDDVEVDGDSDVLSDGDVE